MTAITTPPMEAMAPLTELDITLHWAVTASPITLVAGVTRATMGELVATNDPSTPKGPPITFHAPNMVDMVDTTE